jgi:cell division protein FtsB
MSFGRQNITTDLGWESSSISDFQKRLEPLPVISPSRELPLLATIRVHEGVTIGGRIMQAQRILKPIELVKKNAEIERLRQELAALNARIEELEKQHPEASKIEALRVNALVLARQIDEIRCSSANDLADLLAR